LNEASATSILVLSIPEVYAKLVVSD